MVASISIPIRSAQSVLNVRAVMPPRRVKGQMPSGHMTSHCVKTVANFLTKVRFFFSFFFQKIVKCQVGFETLHGGNLIWKGLR